MRHALQSHVCSAFLASICAALHQPLPDTVKCGETATECLLASVWRWGMSQITYFKKPVRASDSSLELYSHGAFPRPDGTTRFSLWAPDADKVEVSLGDGRVYPLEYETDGWYSARVECV